MRKLENKALNTKLNFTNRRKRRFKLKKISAKFTGKKNFLHLAPNLRADNLIKRIFRKSKLNTNLLRETNMLTYQNEGKLPFSSDEKISFKERLKHELSNLELHFFIAINSALGFLAFNGYFKLSLILFSITLYLYKNHLENLNNHLLSDCLCLINQRPEYQGNFLQRMNTAQLIKLQTGDQIDERAKWLNDFLVKFWPYINCLIQKEIDKKGFTKNGANIGNGHVIYFERFTLGDKPPVITAISVNKSGLRNDELVIDLKMLYSGNCLLSFSKKTLIFFCMKAGVKDIYFRCNARLTLRPLMNKPPYFGGYSFCLLDKPIIDYEGFNLANLVDNQLFKTYLVNQISHLVVSPHHLYYALVKDKEIIRQIKHPSPIGLCFFEIIEAESLPPLDIHHFFLTSFSDPFCLIRIGSSSFETPVVYGSSNPYWYSSNSATIHDLFDFVRINIYDKDALSSDDFIGSIEFCIRDVALDVNFNGVDKWCPISRSKTGNIHFRITYFKLINQINNDLLEKNIELIQKSLVKFPLGILELYLYSLKLFKKHDKKIEPVIQIKFNGITYQTEKLNISDHKYIYKIEQGYQFNTSNPKQDIIEFTVLDMSSFNLGKLVYVDSLNNQIIGNFALSVQTILNKQLISNRKNFQLNPTINSVNTNEENSKNGLIQKFQIYSNTTDNSKRFVVGQIKVFTCLSLCKIDENVYHNLQKRLEIKSNRNQITNETPLFKRFLMHPIISLMYSFRSLQSIHSQHNLKINRITVVDNMAPLPSDLNQHLCYIKVRFNRYEPKRLYIEVLRIINLPRQWIDVNIRYFVSIKLNFNTDCAEKVLNEVKSKNYLSKKLVKTTNKLSYNFKYNSIIFNQRLTFSINPDLQLEHHKMQIQLNINKYSYRFYLISKNSIQTNLITLPSIMFKSDSIERWIPFNIKPS